HFQAKGTVNNTTIINGSELSDDKIPLSSKYTFVMINTTSLTNCISPDILKIQNNYSGNSHLPNNEFIHQLKNNNIVENTKINSSSNQGICKIFSISDSVDCFRYFASNHSQRPCKTFDKSEEITVTDLDRGNFGKKGFLLADTKFDNQYSFEMADPLNQEKKFRVSLDFQEHTQSENNDINSPRLEIIRVNSEGLPDMSATKNQEIIWTGNIFGYFEKPEDDFANETYIAIQFNTGRHGSNENDQERGFGVLFDVSGSNNPNLFEYRDDGKYVKYNYDTIKQLAGDSFVFHHKDNESGGPLFINNLTNSENVKLKVRTLLIENNTRTVETFIGNASSGIEIPYWTLNNLSKLKEHEDIDDESGFIDTVNQGSGYVIARTDNIDTRPTSFRSFSFNK
ncbi:MAG: hypothetical protein L0H53_08970, partial [Candidatus Nitrosocosmicus sp.]|nr:hypothetical protein [Candidatus Nitrosocosmicus sp.]